MPDTDGLNANANGLESGEEINRPRSLAAVQSDSAGSISQDSRSTTSTTLGRVREMSTIVLVGDETGLLKLVNLDYGVCKEASLTGNRNVVKMYGGEQSRAVGIRSIDEVFSKQVFTVLRCNGNIESWKLSDDGNDITLCDTLEVGIDEPVKCASLPDKCIEVCFNAKGQIVVLNSAVQTSDAFKLRICGEFTVKGGSGLQASAINYQEDSIHLALGGKEVDLKVYDVETQQAIFEARNVPHDKLSLRVPIWITAISFLHGNSSRLVTGTAYRQVRVYDTKATDRRPHTSFDMHDEFRVVSICPAGDTGLYVGDTSGGLHLWDLRMQRRVNTLHGFAGSVRGLCFSEEGGALAAVGLDRYLRVFDTRRNKLAAAAYLKNRLVACAIVSSMGSGGDGGRDYDCDGLIEYDMSEDEED